MSPTEWALAWERQIILEIVRDAEPLQEISILLERLNEREIRNFRPAFPDPERIAADAVMRSVAAGESNTDPKDLPRLTIDLASTLEAELSRSCELLINRGAAALAEHLESLIEPELLYQSPSGEFVESCTRTEYWGMWYPGLLNDEQTMQELVDSLPGLDEGSIPKEVQAAEDPSSSTALPGAVSLAWHDAMHGLLGRGLLDQDEAFVVGFAMGNASSFRGEDAVKLRRMFAESYPEPFRVHGQKLMAFDLGIEAGRVVGERDIADREESIPYHATLEEWRNRLGISKQVLYDFYAQERSLLPKTLESARLPRKP
ncbi:MAG: hypothetical protein MUF23_06455 [Pirellula sp.]|jgi:hypothetical protein|nr:hypothetical protein [Pirellula sp.]